MTLLTVGGCHGRPGRPGAGCSLRAVTFNVGCPQIGTNTCADGIGHAVAGEGKGVV
jgi:hypothetical protein